MVNFSKDSTKPSFLKRDKVSDKASARSSATRDLTAAEVFASSKPAESTANTEATSDNVADAESAPDFQYTGSGRKSTAKGKGKGILKKGGPLAIIISLLFGGGFALFGSTSLLGAHLSSIFTLGTDAQYPSYVLRSSRIMNFMLSGDDQIDTTWKGAKKYNHFSNKLQTRLAKNGIEVGHIDTDGNFTIGDSSLSSSKSRVLKFGDDIIDADNFSVKYATNPEFRDAYTKAKRGRVAGFFDKVADSIYEKLGISRNVFDKFKTTGDADVDDANYKAKLGDEFDDVDGTIRAHNTGDEADTDENGKVKTDENGNPIIKTDEDGNPSKVKTDTDSSSKSLSGTAEAKAKAYLDGISKVTQVANIACAVMKIGNMISIAVAANEIYQSIVYFQTNMENVSKMMAGEGDASAVNSFLNSMTTPATANITDIQKSAATVSTDSSSVETIEMTGSPLEAEGMKLLLGSKSINKNSANNFSLERIKFALTTTVASLVGCSAAQTVAAVVSIVSTIMTFGIGAVIETVISFGAQIAIGLTLAWLIPTIAKSMFSNPADLVGIEAGEFMAKGAQAANSRVARSGSGLMPASSEQALAYNQATQQVLAMDAEIDRLHHSPFDITSENTFLGSITHSIISIAATSSGSTFTSVASGISNLANNSIASLLPATYADGSGTNYQTTFGECENLESIGVVGDIYCNPIVAGDLSTINLDPSTNTTYQAKISSQVTINDDGTETINKNSDLYYYVNYCTERDSPFGIVDANILGQMNALNIDNTVASSAVNSLPIINDLLDMFEAGSNIAHMDWATGQNCVNSSKNTRWDNEMKYYQRYTEDARILEQMGSIETNPVTVAKEEYLKDYPLDNSRSGYLSRIAGITKDDAETVLAMADYYNFIAEYNPSERLAFGAKEESTPIYDFNSEAGTYIAYLHPIVYSDIRNRTYAV